MVRLARVIQNQHTPSPAIAVGLRAQLATPPRTCLKITVQDPNPRPAIELSPIGISFGKRAPWTAVAIGMLAVFCAAWAALDLLHVDVEYLLLPYFQHEALPSISETQLSGMPPAPSGGGWDGVAGLNVMTEGVGPDAVMHLTAVGTRQHAFNFHLSSFPPGTAFRVSAEVQRERGLTNIFVEVRDSETSRGTATHYAKIYLNLSATYISAKQGDAVPFGIEAVADGWERIWVDQRTADGAAFVQYQLFDDHNAVEFRSEGQQLRIRRISVTPVLPP